MNEYLELRKELRIIITGLLAMNNLQDPDGDPAGILIQNSATEYWLQTRYNAFLRLEICTKSMNQFFTNDEFRRLIQMIRSEDSENVHVARAILDEKIKTL